MKTEKSSSLAIGNTAAAAAAAAAAAESFVTERMRQDSEQAFAKLTEYYQDKKNKTPRDKKARPLLLQSPAAMVDYLEQHDIQSILFDCDGVVYRTPDPAPGAAASLQAMLKAGRQVYFVTNNSTANPAQLHDKLRNILRVKEDNDHELHLTQDMMISTTLTVAHYLKQHLLVNQNDTTPRVYVIGSQGLCEAIRQAGLQVIAADDDIVNDQASMTRDDLATYDFDALGQVEAVVVGHDTGFSFRKLCIANGLLQRHPEALLVATNRDAFDLVGADGRQLPGNGSLVQALAYSSGRPVIDCGKPSPILADIMTDLYGLDCRRSMFVGDRLDTDIQFALSTGMHAALVLTGVTSIDQIKQQQQALDADDKLKDNLPVPNVIIPHVGYLAG